MPKYLIEAKLTAEGLKAIQSEGGSARREPVRKLVESLGGRFESLHFAFGEYDSYTIAELPDNESAAAAALAVSSSGAMVTKVVVLLTPAEVDAAAQRSAALDYEPLAT